jgi:hypothetical protein
MKDYISLFAIHLYFALAFIHSLNNEWNYHAPGSPW